MPLVTLAATPNLKHTSTMVVATTLMLIKEILELTVTKRMLANFSVLLYLCSNKDWHFNKAAQSCEIHRLGPNEFISID